MLEKKGSHLQTEAGSEKAKMKMLILSSDSDYDHQTLPINSAELISFPAGVHIL